MLHFLKTPLVWLLMLSIPAQGFAASAMLTCGPMHERIAAFEASDGHAHQHEVATSAPEHETGRDDQHGGAVASSDTGPSAASEYSGSGCSACATCCVGVALLAFPPDLAMPAMAGDRILSAFQFPTAFVTGGPKRPPRSRLA